MADDLPSPSKPLSFSPDREGAAVTPAGLDAASILRTKEAAISFLARAHYHQVQVLSVVAAEDPAWEHLFASIRPLSVTSGPEAWTEGCLLEMAHAYTLVPTQEAGFARFCQAARRPAMDLEFIMGGTKPPPLLKLPFALIPVGGLPGAGVTNPTGILTVATSEPMLDYVLPESWKLAIAEWYGCKRLFFVYSPLSSMRKLLRIYESEGFTIPYRDVALPEVAPLDNSQRPSLPPGIQERGHALVDVSVLQPRGEAAEMFPMGFQTKHRMIPIYGNSVASLLVLAAAEVPTEQLKYELERQITSRQTGQKQKVRLAFVLGDPEQINAVVARGESANADMDVLVRNVRERVQDGGQGGGAANVTQIDMEQLIAASKGEGGAEVNASDVLNLILAEAMDLGASDVHISNHQQQPEKAGDPPISFTRVRYTVDGETRAHTSRFPEELGPLLINAIKVRARIQSGRNLTAKDGEFPMDYGREKPIRYDLRVNVQNTTHGEYAVMRLQNTSSAIRSFKDLGMRQREIDILRVAMTRTVGFLVICGATGNGKSNTIWGWINGIDREKKNVISLESPVERKLDGVEQVPVGNAPGNTFADGIRAALREAPHYIIVGETRDLETMRTALEAAETGHFVATTLHANTAAEAPARLLNMGDREGMNARAYTLSTCLYAIMAQRLVRLLCTCSVARPGPTREELIRGGVREERLKLFEGIDTVRAIRENGCPHCRRAGERGRTGIYECLLVTPEVRAAIRDQRNIEEIRALQSAQGASSIFEQAVDLLKAGRITLQRCLDLQPD